MSPSSNPRLKNPFGDDAPISRRGLLKGFGATAGAAALPTALAACGSDSGSSSSSGGGSSSSSGGSSGGSQQLNQVVLPDNSGVRTVIVPPCVPSATATSQEQSAGKSNVLRATSRSRTVTAPACLVSQSSSSSSSGG
jgi:hypothetical protein